MVSQSQTSHDSEEGHKQQKGRGEENKTPQVILLTLDLASLPHYSLGTVYKFRVFFRRKEMEAALKGEGERSGGSWEAGGGLEEVWETACLPPLAAKTTR